VPDRLPRLVVLLALATATHGAARGALLAEKGRARAVVVVADHATAAEATAARELATYLRKAASARFRVVREASRARVPVRLYVGPTARARALGLAPELLGPEEWVLRRDGDDLVLVGGRPRGTLYAVYHWLEDDLRVRWWNAFEESVPSRAVLEVPFRDARGAPAFPFRDVGQIDGPSVFLARNRINGNSSWIDESHGGSIAISPARNSAHNEHHYVPAREYFGREPRMFAEIGGARTPGGPLCLSFPATFGAALATLRRDMAIAPAVRYFDFSPEDSSVWCDCERCRADLSHFGNRSDQLLGFVNGLAEAVTKDRPGTFLTTLAYLTTFSPPVRVRARDDVIVRFSSLQWKDFAKPISDAENDEARDAFLGWRKAAPRLWVWDYGVTFGDYPEMPFPSIEPLAADLRFYRAQAVEGVLVQEDFPIRAHLRDLKLWVTIKLLEDPEQDVEAIVRDFTDGYYGTAGSLVREYLDLLSGAFGRHPSRIGTAPDPSRYAHLDLAFFGQASRILDDAARRVRGNAVLERRIRHLGLPLDRALLFRLYDLEDEAEGNGAANGGSVPFSRSEVERRCRTVWREQVKFRSYRKGLDAVALRDAEPDCGWDMPPERVDRGRW
jgi:hypothetical protein